ncbi:MAG: iron export ABC transporter permease subunit FetB [Gammaproteobacteria bacterium]|nr:iron export ABC transporter permease subunit FetB [Gammaproteobacteria bacterium]
MELIQLGYPDLAIAALLIIGLAAISWRFSLGIESRLLISALRTVIQLSLIGLVLKQIFSQNHPLIIGLLCFIMLAIAGYEVMARQKRRFTGGWGYSIGALSMFISTFSITLLALHLVIGVDPWYTPQYLIPLLGMLLGNTMNGIAIAIDNLTQLAWQQRGAIEARLMLGHSRKEAIGEIQRTALRAGLIPIINAMSIAGLVSLPGMMTGQILAGSPPQEAAKYQIMMMLLIAGATGIGAVIAVTMGGRRLFDERDRLRLERLKKG